MPTAAETPVAPAIVTPRILIVEDEEKTRESLAEGLRLEQWSVGTAEDARRALELATRQPHDLMIVDWMLPDQDGTELIRELRCRGIEARILMLTARTAASDRLTGLAVGADDYMAKPFAFSELIARCRRLLRPSTSTAGDVFRYGDLVVDPKLRVAVRGDRPLALTPREFEVLMYFMGNAGEIVTRDMLARDVWKAALGGAALESAVDLQVGRLREKVDSAPAPTLIHLVRGLGYRFGAAPVRSGS